MIHISEKRFKSKAGATQQAGRLLCAWQASTQHSRGMVWGTHILMYAVLVLSAAAGPALAQDDGEGTDNGENRQTILEDQNIILPAAVEPGPIVNALKAGHFQQAVTAANNALAEPGGSPEEMYLRGVAHLALAEQNNNEKRYKEAGLSFMGVEIYFGHTGGEFIGPSLVEAGYVHDRIGRPEKATQLYDQAAELISEQDDPRYYKHLQARRAFNK